VLLCQGVIATIRSADKYHHDDEEYKTQQDRAPYEPELLSAALEESPIGPPLDSPHEPPLELFGVYRRTSR